ncbi:hypothetical protein U9M48_004866, partial [Paspalum notatum var. saurae]
ATQRPIHREIPCNFPDVSTWAERHGVAQEEVARLRAELRRANLVLGAAREGAGGGRRIGNEQLAEPVATVRRLTADARSAASSTSSATSTSTTRSKIKSITPAARVRQR